MIKRLKKVSERLRTLKMQSLKNFCTYPINLSLIDDKLKSEYGLEPMGKKCPTDRGILVFYEAHGNIFAMCDDGRLVVCKANEYTEYDYLESMDASVVEIYLNGKKRVLIASDVLPYIMGGEELEEFPISQCVLTYLGRLIVGGNNSIWIGKPFDYEGINTSVEFEDKINIDGDKVLEFFSSGNSIYAFCENSIRRIIFDENDKVNNLIFVSPFGIGKNGLSFARDINFCAYYKDCLTTFDGDNFKRLSTILDDISFEVISKALIVNGKYFLNILTDEGEQLTYVYDFLTKEQAFIKVEGGSLSGNLVALDGEVYKITKGASYFLDKCARFIFDFNSAREKTLHYVELFVSNDCQMQISGSFGKKEYSLKKGLNAIKTNLSSQVFDIRITEERYGLNVEKISLKYTIKGE